MDFKRAFFLVIHLFFASGLLYAFGHFVKTPRTEVLARRLWAYENWIILSFYAIFVYLTLEDRDITLESSKDARKVVSKFKDLLVVNLILLILPWGLFLVFAPQHLLDLFRLHSIYWRLLGIGSLFGAIIYFFPYRFYYKRFSFYLIVFGAIDNFLAAVALTVLFISRKVPLIAWSSSPLLMYFSYIFFRQARDYQKTVKGGATDGS